MKEFKSKMKKAFDPAILTKMTKDFDPSAMDTAALHAKYTLHLHSSTEAISRAELMYTQHNDGPGREAHLDRRLKVPDRALRAGDGVLLHVRLLVAPRSVPRGSRCEVGHKGDAEYPQSVWLLAAYSSISFSSATRSA